MNETNIDQWWPKLKPATRAWLMDNNGDAMPDEVVTEITAAGGVLTAASLSDEDMDWIEAVANGESPKAG